MTLQLYNTLGRKIEEFTPIKNGKQVGIYTCGPTVYDYAHIGNLRSYIFADIVRRTLEWNGYEVRQIMNITDVGHLANDRDDGEDKMTKALIREGKPLTIESLKELADRYANAFIADLEQLNIEKPAVMPKATEHITEDIALVKKLLDSGHAYQTSDGIYFDVAQWPDYGVLAGGRQVLENNEAGTRVAVNPEKYSPADFALWKFNPNLGWETPWGKGFPGWHIECSAMAMKYLGESFDIHTGGIDHIPIHHTNEIAQSEAASGKPYVRYWLHGAFLNVDGERVAKSLGTGITLHEIIDRGLNPLAYRLWILMAHYRSPINFHWEALEAANTALSRLYALFHALDDQQREDGQGGQIDVAGQIIPSYHDVFATDINDDLNTPKVVATLWSLLRDEQYSAADRRATVLDFDRVLGLGFAKAIEQTDEKNTRAVPTEVQNLLDERAAARTAKDFTKADELRERIAALGYDVQDTAEGQDIQKRK